VGSFWTGATSCYLRDLSVLGFWHPRGGPGSRALSRDKCAQIFLHLLFSLLNRHFGSLLRGKDIGISSKAPQ
jgi:hypothetical protein